ncbi:MAG: 1-phosphofructokinase family hexose kinase [Christensenellaceae bacterium]
MIFTVCPNPCIDCTLELDKFNVGRLNRIETKNELCAGKALNTAVGVSRLKKKAFATGFLFDNGGKRVVNYLEREGVHSKFVWNKGRVRVNYKIIDSKSMMTEINDRGDNVSLKKQNELIELVGTLSNENDFSVAVMSGSLPQGVDDDFYAKLIRNVDKKTKVIVDCETAKMIYAISQGVYLVKPNLNELEDVNRETYQSFPEMLKGCYKLIDHGAENVMLSLGKEGAIITNGTENYYCKSENVIVNSSVGAGDSMLAAASCCIEEGASLSEILRASVSAGSASVTTAGTNLFYRDKYNEIYAKVSPIKI